MLGGFGAFGLFWGGWGAALPAVQAHARVDDGQLGVALLCIGAGALASMRIAGTLVDRFTQAALPVGMLALAGAALLPGLATSPLALSGALLAWDPAPRGTGTFTFSGFAYDIQLQGRIATLGGDFSTLLDRIRSGVGVVTTLDAQPQ